jgi:ornithine carbamoyltransferase
MPRHLVNLDDWSREEIDDAFHLAADLKNRRARGQATPVLAGKTLALVFHKPSLRTRVSFEAGMHQLGGDALYLSEAEIGLGKRESIADVGRVLSSMVDGIMIRTFAHAPVEELARHSRVPIINGLTDFSHPCQILADLFTLWERGKRLDEIKVAWIGDGNNVLQSWMEAATRFRFRLAAATPAGYEPPAAQVERLRPRAPGGIELTRDPRVAVKGANVIYTDVWASMGQEAEAEKRKRDFGGFQVNEALVAAAAPDAVVMHCLPAHRGEEITEGVLEGPRSIVFPQAENRMHLQKALLVRLMAPGHAV